MNMLNILFLSGVFITITGWYLERAKTFDWLLSRIASDYVAATKALTDLKQNEKIALTHLHCGFQPLVNKWPNLSQSKESIKFIGRSVAYIDFMAGATNDIELIAYDINKTKINEVWKMSEAKAIIEDDLARRTLLLGAIIFWVGIIVTTTSHILSSKASS